MVRIEEEVVAEEASRDENMYRYVGTLFHGDGDEGLMMRRERRFCTKSWKVRLRVSTRRRICWAKLALERL
jgi:hypothetical protein